MIRMTDKQYAALPEVTEHYWPDTGDKVEMSIDPHTSDLIVRVFNGSLSPREVRIKSDGGVR